MASECSFNSDTGDLQTPSLGGSGSPMIVDPRQEHLEQDFTTSHNNRPPRWVNATLDQFGGTAMYHLYRLGEQRDPFPNPRQTLYEIQQAVNERTSLGDGGFVNIGEIPSGLGRFEWLELNVDDVWAQQIGFTDPSQIEEARGAGYFSRGPYPQDSPMTVWYPYRPYLNPDSEPGVPGQWAFHTSYPANSDKQKAESFFGGLLGREPTAKDVWHLRIQLLDPRSENVDLVWIPHQKEDSDSDDNDGNELIPFGHKLGQVDPFSGLIHNPLNRGENDQTGGYNADYYTRSINRRAYTLDRQRAHHNHAEPHKSWVVDKSGHWMQWPGYGTLNWSIKDAVERMNKWRVQKLSRDGWPAKRAEAGTAAPVQRKGYTDGQLDWLMDDIKKGKGKLTMRISKLAAEFNRRFKEERPDSGVQSCVNRLIAQYKKYGDRKPKTGTQDGTPEQESEAEDEEEM
ncbi:hypothetical protein BAUCODRAFT_275033 [Baudoinia panamericana UAMH 10762]|uniref:Uncharacterized protein n=1 Tax=Baudoinia panamericana (strain UAMH 10762) TaxID=717646 RepID=M2MZG9_BAUPA|nr:uncharacterized protein BAUCODRAFT_275033 [Baudoinia panamericana UAMH 10762]EMC92069.1 hypothetical protein BAUCODRAFT_275033 [Baudoinia panamericana UAMH 10762]